MSISLSKGNSVNLTKEEPTLKKIMIGLGWDTGDNVIDLDACAFMLGANGKIPSDEYFVFYNNLKSPDNSIQHTGDNRTGEGEGDDEMILANLDLVNPKITEIIITASIHDARKRGQHLGQLKNAFIRLYDVDSKKEILKYILNEKLDHCTEIEFGKLQKVNEEWKFVALGNGSSKGLQGFVDIYA
ncbi:MAG TPA: TerD family protein [Cytophagaceae bacterium]|jgi:tellurium resistance protein TerD|nr:TerD family protein [Cytophagaceae bacterium]